MILWHRNNNIPRVLPEANRPKKEATALFSILVAFVGPYKLLHADKVENLADTQLAEVEVRWQEGGAGTISLLAVGWVVNQWSIEKGHQRPVSIAPTWCPGSSQKGIAPPFWVVLERYRAVWKGCRYIPCNMGFAMFSVNCFNQIWDFSGLDMHSRFT